MEQCDGGQVVQVEMVEGKVHLMNQPLQCCSILAILTVTIYTNCW